MGEKIRDIHPIKIGNSSLMIELNEGYTASQGRLIHIQNKKFRYLLTEKDFYHLSTMVMRAWSEFMFVKKQPIEQKDESSFSTREVVSNGTIDKLKSFTQLLHATMIEYRILDIQNKMITVIVKEDCIKKFKKSIAKHGYKATSHPLGVNYGYHFLYQMVPFLLYEYEGVFIEVYCQLPCASLTPKTWIPLDRAIQKEIWDSENSDDIRMCNKLCQYIYHLCWAIFFNKGFSPYAKSFLSENKELLKSSKMSDCLYVVFFAYTPTLIEYIESNNFDAIISNYYSYVNY